MHRAYDDVLGGTRSSRDLRSVVSASWGRSLRARVDPEGSAPPLVYDPDELREVRSGHPLAAVVPTLRRVLDAAVDASAQLLIVTDADGRILWREGAAPVRGAADRVLLTEGTQWREDTIGTNAMGTALATGRPVQIYAAEHLVRAYHTWTCAACPITDPDTGRLLGTVDVSGQQDSVHPAMVQLVSAASELAEKELRLRMMAADQRLRERRLPELRRLGGQPGALLSGSGRVVATHRRDDCPVALPDRVDTTGDGRVDLGGGVHGTLEPLTEGWLLRLPRPRARSSSNPSKSGRRPVSQAAAAPPSPRTLALRLLGPNAPAVRLGGRCVPVSLRHAEILALLALHPEGRTAEQLALGLYGEDGNPTTVRVEVHRLRAQLGQRVLLPRPYRLAAVPDCDLLWVRDRLAAGDVRAALAAYRGELLGRSEAPGVRTVRDEVAATLRTSVLELGDSELLWQLACRDLGREDAQVLEALVASLPRTSPRRASALERLRALLASDG
ncbi:GAF domain-containing protein [Thermobifida halotolerans]|uniref:GAF domain-containing protein n=1 Tax=Thermobifida halotolerans TaxID=483545 RepID=A0AA97M1N3_9ACTN|nr:GAF domain-containing protein [Thermobifida halotolerans]